MCLEGNDTGLSSTTTVGVPSSRKEVVDDIPFRRSVATCSYNIEECGAMGRRGAIAVWDYLNSTKSADEGGSCLSACTRTFDQQLSSFKSVVS